MEKRFESFTTLILQLNRTVQHIKSAEMAKLDLKGIHATCLVFLQASGGMTQSELTRQCAEDKATISRALTTLVERGLVTFEQKTATRRYRGVLVLTEAGQEAANRVSTMVDSAVNAGGSGLTDEEREIMYRCLSMVNRNLLEYSGQSEE